MSYRVRMCQNTTKIGVVGAGAYGTALADLLCEKGHDVTLWAREPEVVHQIMTRHENETFLPRFKLCEKLTATTDLKEVATDKEMVVVVVPTQFVRSVLDRLRLLLSPSSVILCGAKGIETSSLKLLSDVFKEVLPPSFHPRLAFLSGPTFARDLVQGGPAAVDIACSDEALGRRIQEVVRTLNFEVEWTDDVIGVELGGAMKNVVAIACGISDGLGFGDTTRTMLMTLGLREMVQLGKKIGARAETFYGLSGVGDLVLTCNGELSRNKTLGIEIGRGKSLEDIQSGRQSVAEGVATAKAVNHLAKEHHLDLPVCHRVYRILYEGDSPRSLFDPLAKL